MGHCSHRQNSVYGEDLKETYHEKEEERESNGAQERQPKQIGGELRIKRNLRVVYW